MAKDGKTEEVPEITPQVLHLRDLLKWVRQGRVRVPNFQRDFVWDRERITNLFDSIRKQYPIGTLLFWEPGQPVPMSSRLGPLQLPEDQSGTYLVLDGQQRLTTLAGVLLHDENHGFERDRDDDPGRWSIYYDAKDNAFVCHDDPKRAPVHAVRVADLMATKGILAAAKRIMAVTDDEGADLAAQQRSAQQRSEWIERIEAASAALAAYRVPLVIFATRSLRLAVESFTRLNRAGQSVGPDEMFSALTYQAEGEAESFRLSTHIDSILGDLRHVGFGSIDRVVVLRSVLLAANLDPFRTEWDSLAEDTRKHASSKLADVIEDVRRGLLAAVAFLREEGVWNSRLLPYGIQIVGLAAFFERRVNPPTAAQKALLRRWLWVSSFTGAFGGSNPSRVLLQLKALRDEVPLDDTPTTIAGIDLQAPALPFPARHDHRSARVRALLCIMLRQPIKLDDEREDQPEDMAAIVLQRGPEAFRQVCARGVGKPLGSSPANRVFARAAGRGQAKAWLLEASDAVLASHHISAEAKRALVEGDHRAFVELRLHTLLELELEFMAEKGVTPPLTRIPAPSPVDTEDEVPLSDDVDE